MYCPTPTDLPPPPLGRTGWPWTGTNPKVGGTTPDGCPWSQVSIVMPSYNQGEFIEETIRSVLLQGYPNLQYMIIDGGSTDGSLEIIRRYEPWLSYWVSEPDQGQAHAINKGWERATGEFVTWLNSDDLLLPGSLLKTVTALVGDQSLDIVYGDVLKVDANSEPFRKPYDRIKARPFDLYQMLVEWHNPVPQQGFLMRHALLEQIGYLDEAFHFAMDFEYWVRIAVNGGHGKALPHLLGAFRHHEEAKSSTIQQERVRNRFQIYEQVFLGDQIHPRLNGLAIRSRRNLTRHATYISYAAGDTKSVRKHAGQYNALAGIRSLPFAVSMFVLSLMGGSSLQAMRHFVRRLRTSLAAFRHG